MQFRTPEKSLTPSLNPGLGLHKMIFNPEPCPANMQISSSETLNVKLPKRAGGGSPNPKLASPKIYILPYFYMLYISSERIHAILCCYIILYYIISFYTPNSQTPNPYFSEPQEALELLPTLLSLLMTGAIDLLRGRGKRRFN